MAGELRVKAEAIARKRRANALKENVKNGRRENAIRLATSQRPLSSWTCATLMAGTGATRSHNGSRQSERGTRRSVAGSPGKRPVCERPRIALRSRKTCLGFELA
jgi:hypothetical protein